MKSRHYIRIAILERMQSLWFWIYSGKMIYKRSKWYKIGNYLNTVSDIKYCREWKEIFELRAREERTSVDI